jgi:hypothetical protein
MRASPPYQGHHCRALICEAFDHVNLLTPNSRSFRSPSDIRGDLLNLFPGAQTFLYRPGSKPDVKSRFCYPNEKGKMVCK